MPYIGKTTDGFGIRERFTYLASAGATSISGADANGKTLLYEDPEYVDVFLNGIRLKKGTDYNTSTANTIAGLAALAENDEVEVIVQDVFTLADMVSANTGGDFRGSIAIQKDSGALSFGADKEITITHSADTGLVFKNTNTGNDNPFTLTLQTGETDIAASDNLGVINFQAPDEGTGTDAILVAAGIEAVSEGDFSSSTNATKLSFKTASTSTAAETMSLSSAGNLTVSGTYTGGGLMTTGGNIVIPDAGTIGSASDINAIAISSAGVITISTNTDSTSSTSGALIAHSAGFADDVFIGDTLNIAGSDGVDISQGAISIKNGGTQSYVRFYCESSNAHYAQLQAPAHADFSGNITLTLPAVTDTVAGIAATQTLTNKTLTTPVIAEITSGSTITLNATTDIVLDADGDEVIFKDGSTNVGHVSMDSDNLTIKSLVSDKDMIFQGNDGGSAITALTLDMSEAGAATFNSKIIATELDISGDIDIDGTSNLDIVDIDGAVDMASTLQVDGAITSSSGMTITTADNTAQLTLVSTDADADKGPVFQLKRDSGSPADNDILGRVLFQFDDDGGNETTAVQIEASATDVSDGSEDASLNIVTMVGGTTRGRVKIDPTETIFNDDGVALNFRVESDNNANMLFVDGGNNKVGISNSAPPSLLTLGDGTSNITDYDLSASNSGQDAIFINSSDETSANGAKGNSIGFGAVDGHPNRHASICAVQTGSDRDQVGLAFHVHTSTSQADDMVEAYRIDSSGNLLIGKTGTDFANAGFEFRSGSYMASTNSGGQAAVFNRLSDFGDIVQFHQATTQHGSIAVISPNDLAVVGSADHVGLQFASRSFIPLLRNTNDSGTSQADNAIDLGLGAVRFDDVFATNGTIQTSDKNEKQDIEELSDAEKRVAIVAKGLMRKFRWKDKVAEKGDKARTHFGIIAQDLEDAFKAEGLDASKYAMFCSDTWWEKEISVDAVEADEAKGIEAKDAYTYMDTKEEATEGYTERTRLGVRYPQLLAFIISAI